MVVVGQHFSDDIIQKIKDTLSKEPNISKLALSRKVCQWMDWRDLNGNLKEMSCRIALKKLSEKGIIQFANQVNPFANTPKKARQIDVTIQELCCDLDEIGQISLIPISSRYAKTSKIWNTLMDKYHYLGSGPLCGAQIRYLISSTHGWLGGLAFSSAAWHLEARDSWIGWNDSERKQNLHRVVCNSRFLILPQIKVANLASHVLSLCPSIICKDWHIRYGYNPVLLETFVERGRFKGTCYQAANWNYIGTTKGRGRQDSKFEVPVPPKDIYLLPLNKNAQELLCDAPLPTSEESDHKSTTLTPEDWAEEEFGNAELRDERLRKRLLRIGRDFYSFPQATIPQACQSAAGAKATYRFFKNSHITMEKLLEPHYSATQNRIQREKIVLAVQDTTSLNYSTHPATENLGPIGSEKEGVIGLHVHDTMAFTLEGTPLGLLDVQCWARDANEHGKKHNRKSVPIEQKESYKWLQSFHSVQKAQKQSPDTMLVSVGDREADIYELFELATRDAANPKLLIRAEQNRCLTNDQGCLKAVLYNEPVRGVQEIFVPRQGKRCPRNANLDIRFSKINLKPPRGKSKLGEITLWAVSAKETNAPDGVPPLDWLLLTNIETDTLEKAIEKLQWYKLRWWIEVYHRTLKSGCKIEDRRLGKADSIKACLAIDMVVAWRVFHLTKLGRETPNVPCSVYFEEAEWKALTLFVTKQPAKKEPLLREAMRMTASLGGFLGRKCDGNPGTKSLWLGLQRLADITEMWLVCNSRPTANSPPVSRKMDYG